MAEQEQTSPSGHYSGRNRIPNIKQFMDGLDKQKKHRDAEIDHGTAAVPMGGSKKGNEVMEHVESKKHGQNPRIVRDPVTGQDVEIADIDSRHVESAKNPMVSQEAFGT